MDEEETIKKSLQKQAVQFAMGGMLLSANMIASNIDREEIERLLLLMREECKRIGMKIDRAAYSRKYKWIIQGVHQGEDGRNYPTAITRLFPGEQTYFVTREAAELQLSHFERWLKALQGESDDPD